jgi:hypothetical protein
MKVEDQTPNAATLRENEEAIEQFVARIPKLSESAGIAFGAAPPPTEDVLEQLIKDARSGRLRRIQAWESDAKIGILRYRFLIACKELGINKSKWPAFNNVIVPSGAPVSYPPPPFCLPPFDLLHDSKAEWLARANKDWQKYSRKVGSDCLLKIKALENAGILLSLARSRGRGKASPLLRRLEWAALFCCSGWSYGRITTSNKHNPEQKPERTIITAVTRIMSALDLKRED